MRCTMFYSSSLSTPIEVRNASVVTVGSFILAFINV